MTAFPKYASGFAENPKRAAENPTATATFQNVTDETDNAQLRSKKTSPDLNYSAESKSPQTLSNKKAARKCKKKTPGGPADFTNVFSAHDYALELLGSVPLPQIKKIVLFCAGAVPLIWKSPLS